MDDITVLVLTEHARNEQWLPGFKYCSTALIAQLI